MDEFDVVEELEIGFDNPIHLFARTMVVEGVIEDIDVLAEMHAWLTTELNKLGFEFHRVFRKEAGSLWVKWLD